MWYYLVIGFVVGLSPLLVIKLVLPIAGVLRIDRSDGFDGPHLFLELHEGVASISRKKYVRLLVKDENFNTEFKKVPRN